VVLLFIMQVAAVVDFISSTPVPVFGQQVV
jgi:hypothetical protein